MQDPEIRNILLDPVMRQVGIKENHVNEYYFKVWISFPLCYCNIFYVAYQIYIYIYIMLIKSFALGQVLIDFKLFR